MSNLILYIVISLFFVCFGILIGFWVAMLKLEKYMKWIDNIGGF